MTGQRLFLSAQRMAVPSIAALPDLHGGPAQLQEHRWFAEEHLTGSTQGGLIHKRQRGQRARASPHRALPLALAAPPAHPGSPRSPIPHGRPPTHPRGHWPSLSPNPGVRLLSTPRLPLLCRFDTMPSSSSSSFRTSLLVYHLFSLSPNIWSKPALRPFVPEV